MDLSHSSLSSPTLFFSFILPFVLCMLDRQAPFTEVLALWPFEKESPFYCRFSSVRVCVCARCVCLNVCDHGLTRFCMHEPQIKDDGRLSGRGCVAECDMAGDRSDSSRTRRSQSLNYPEPAHLFLPLLFWATRTN